MVNTIRVNRMPLAKKRHISWGKRLKFYQGRLGVITVKYTYLTLQSSRPPVNEFIIKPVKWHIMIFYITDVYCN